MTSGYTQWRHLLASYSLGNSSVLTLDATRRLATFIAEHCAHRPYAADWRRYGDDLLATAFAAEARKVETLVASACC